MWDTYRYRSDQVIYLIFHFPADNLLHGLYNYWLSDDRSASWIGSLCEVFANCCRCHYMRRWLGRIPGHHTKSSGKTKRQRYHMIIYVFIYIFDLLEWHLCWSCFDMLYAHVFGLPHLAESHTQCTAIYSCPFADAIRSGEHGHIIVWESAR